MRHRFSFEILAAFGLLLGVQGLANAELVSFVFADPGTSYTGFVFPDDPRVGGQIVSARIVLRVEVFDGADAADFMTDIAFPLIPDPGNTSVLSLTGADLGWSGPGIFTYDEVTTDFNGVFISTLFGAETGSIDAVIYPNSRIEFEYIPVPEPTVGLALGGTWLMLRRRTFEHGRTLRK